MLIDRAQLPARAILPDVSSLAEDDERNRWVR